MSFEPAIPPRCWAEIDCAAIRHNAQVCQKIAGPDCGIMAIVKADAYGHGLEKIGEVLWEAGIRWFGVANVEEALRLQQSISDFDGILVLSPATDAEEIRSILDHGFSATISSVDELKKFAAAAGSQKKARLHVSIDTGMGRMGVSKSHAAELIRAVASEKNVLLEGVASHFPSADEDRGYTEKQIDRFQKLIEPLDIDCHIHLANSAGLIGFGDQISATLARPGLAIYGISPLQKSVTELKPALSLKTRVALIREISTGDSVSYGRTFVAEKPMRVATLAVGYGDGYSRSLSGSGASVLISGTRCPLLGRVTMDQIVVDVSELSAVNPGDTATLIGDEISTSEIAEIAGTIPWEILTGLTNRVKRIYR